MLETVFLSLFAALLSGLLVIRTIYKFKAGVFRRGIYSLDEGVLLIVLRSLLGVPLLAAVVFYFLDPLAPEWTRIDLPVWMRFAGVFLGCAALVLLIRAHRVLGRYFSPTLRFQRDHRLVTEGPSFPKKPNQPTRSFRFSESMRICRFSSSMISPAACLDAEGVTW
ncbi:MAG: hypothetical protein ACLFRY_10795 [Spirochaetia bacterium]